MGCMLESVSIAYGVYKFKRSGTFLYDYIMTQNNLNDCVKNIFASLY